MKTVNIFLFLILTILVSIIVGLKLSNKFMNREEFVVKVSPATSKERCIKSDLEEDRMTRKKAKPPCFFNDLDDTNKDLMGLNAQIRDRTDDIIRKSTMIDDNLHNRAQEGSKKIDIILRSDDLALFNKNIIETSQTLGKNRNTVTEIASKLNTKNVSIDQNRTLTQIQVAVSKLVTQAIDRIISTSSENLSNKIDSKFNDTHAKKIIDKLTILIYDKINNNIFGDISDMVNNLVEKEKLDKLITDVIENFIREDKDFKQYMPGGNNNIQLGDFVYFKHRLEQNIPGLCVDDETQREIILGGKVCAIDPISNKVKINYLFTSNPNYNKRCSKIYSYDKGVSGLPKWYADTDKNLTNMCGPGPFKNAACMPDQWSSDRDNYIKQYVGGFDRNNNEMSCGVGPSIGGDFPTEINIANLSKSLEDIVKSCNNAKLLYKQPKATPLPKPVYNPSVRYTLPIPKLEDMPALPKKTVQQLQREQLQREAELKLARDQEADRLELEALRRAETGVSGLATNIQRRKAEQIALDESPVPRSATTRGTGQGIASSTATPEFVRDEIKRKEPKRDELSLENRCLDVNKDNNKPRRYIIDSSKNRYMIKDGKIMKDDLELKLPGNVAVSYLYRKPARGNMGTIFAYGKDKQWYHYVKDEQTSDDTVSRFKFKRVLADDLASLYDGIIDEKGTCIIGNTI